MPSFGTRSMMHYSTLHPKLQRILYDAILVIDFAILCGHRDEAAQNAAYPVFSKVKWPNSKHNTTPSRAVDIAPWPINWEDEGRFYLVAGVILSCAHDLGITIDGGFNWRWDVGHFQLGENE